MIDWNGNGKIDPVDVGISIAVEEQAEEDNSEPGKPKNTKHPAGCLTSVIFAIGVVVGIVGIGGMIM